jgi:SAM-dependent methyltransferase
METFVDLGEMPLANSYVSDAEAMNERLLPLHVCVCGSCLLVQVTDTVSPGELFSDYAYFSSYARSWVEHARRYAQTTIARYGLGADSLVVEVASNDGYLLQHFQERNIPVLGVEPAVNVAAAATAKGIPTEIAFFGAETARRLAGAGQRADLMVANNVLAHVPDIRDFAEGFAVLLKPEGIATFEFPHVLNLIRGMQFDTIYHEHFSYLSLLVVERAFAAAGLKAIDVQEIPTHGGSLRLFAARQESSHRPADSLDRLRAKEIAAGLGGLEGYRGFAKRVADIKQEFLSFLAGVKAAGKTMAAYGAAAKGNSFLNYCCVGRDDIACVFDRSLAKQGKLLPGSHIPIVGPERLSEVRPDYLLILTWNLAAEIQEDQAILRSWDGKFVTAIPGLRVLP